MRKLSILLIVVLLVCFTLISFATEVIDVKDYIKGKFPTIFNIYLAPLGELDEYEKEFIDLLQNLPEEEQKNFAKEVYDNGFSKEILEDCRGSFIVKEEGPELEIEEEVIDTGKWRCIETIDPIDDSTTIRFILSGGKSVYLNLVYRSGKTQLYINWNDYLDGDSKWVTYRFGTEKARGESWAVSNNNEATFYAPGFFGISSKKTIKFIRKLMTVDQFVAEATPYNENPITAVFDVRGLRDAVEQFNDTLGWIEEDKYAASKNSEVFHYISCSYVASIKPENLILFKSREEVIASGRKPCKKCKP